MVLVIDKIEPISHGSVSTNTLHFLILTSETRLETWISMSIHVVEIMDLPNLS